MSETGDFLARLDYGTVPQWITAVIAGIASVFTIRGILIAGKSYATSVEAAAIAQARLCFGSMRGVHRLTRLQVVPDPSSLEPNALTPFPSRWPTPEVGAGEPFAIFDENQMADATVGWIAPDEIVWHVTILVRNYSEELISDVFATYQFDDSNEHPTAILGLIGPGESVQHEFMIAEDVFGPGGIRIEFTDSAGVRWSRIDGRPVRRVQETPERAKRFACRGVRAFSISPVRLDHG